MSACPKTMVHGPCGGVHADPLGVDATRAAAAAVAGHADAALLGDAPWARVQLPPVLRAQVVAAEGVRPWASLTCRDRNRVALEGEPAGLAAIGVPAVHCVTGDHPVLGQRPEAAPVFDLDSTRLAALAAGSGMLVSVAESPSAPPRERRPARMAAKAAAGAHVCFVNHAAEPGEVEDLVGAVRALAPRVRCIVCVPLVVSEAGLERLAAFVPGAVVPVATIAAAGGDDPVGGAVRSAIATAEGLLAVEGVDGIDLTAAAGPGEELRVAGALALAADALGGGEGT
ncbi:hypothetical protein DSM104299_03348 [Baekduia alba]|uniref:hypothetical protein n=1 Tax=Baekduia alba TaxID=2997333 RepID=UPI002341459F|nr:hypothetical protein [Baekduia alba]WCB94610.1 hypothetical protein DSM104299_03348 [Baekduia alba]